MGDPYPGKIRYWGGTPLQLTYEEVVASLGLAGWPESLWPKAAAVITAESNRETNVYNTYLDGHFGLMQLGKQQHPELFASNDPNAWVNPVNNCKSGYAIYQSQGWGAWEGETNGHYGAYLLQATAATNSVKSHIAKGQLAPKALPSAGPHNRQQVLESYLHQKGDAIIEQLGIIALSEGTNSLVNNLADAGTKTGDVTVAAGAAAAQSAADIQSNSLLGAVEMMIGAGKWMADPHNWIRVAQVLAGGALLVAGISIVARPIAGPIAGALPSGKIMKAVGKVAGK